MPLVWLKSQTYLNLLVPVQQQSQCLHSIPWGSLDSKSLFGKRPGVKPTPLMQQKSKLIHVSGLVLVRGIGHGIHCVAIPILFPSPVHLLLFSLLHPLTTFPHLLYSTCSDRHPSLCRCICQSIPTSGPQACTGRAVTPVTEVAHRIGP